MADELEFRLDPVDAAMLAELAQRNGTTVEIEIRRLLRREMDRVAHAVFTEDDCPGKQ